MYKEKVFGFQARLEQVREMDYIICNEISDEMAWMRWICIMPDQPQEDDYEWFAGDDYEYTDLLEFFNELVDNYR